MPTEPEVAKLFKIYAGLLKNGWSVKWRLTGPVWWQVEWSRGTSKILGMLMTTKKKALSTSLETMEPYST